MEFLGLNDIIGHLIGPSHKFGDRKALWIAILWKLTFTRLVRKNNIKLGRVTVNTITDPRHTIAE